MTRTPTVPPRPPCRVYLITPPTIPDLNLFVKELEQALGGGDVAAVQLRLKDVPDEQVVEAAHRLRPIVQAAGAAMILNDRPDLAVATRSDGVHVGQSDASVVAARRIMGGDAMIGATCHDSRHLAMEAAEAGADYVAFGAFFPTTTKAVVHRPEPAILGVWQDTMEIPCVAIGGITAANAADLARAGADFVAVSAAVWGHIEGPEAAVRELNRALAAAF